MDVKPSVLIVEDEFLQQTMASELVEEAGFEVIEASNADEAIRILEERDDIVLIVTDIDMPAGSMNGLRLAAKVKRRWPPIQIIVVSGHYRVTDADLPADSVFLPKPYQSEQLIAHIHRMVA